MALMKRLESLSIPEEEGVVFVRPDVCEWRGRLAQNMSALAGFNGRGASREELVGIAQRFTSEHMKSGCPIGSTEKVIVTGHQAVWGHCGIWIKDAAACRFAEAVGGRSLHLVVDHDICDTSVVVRGHRGGFERIEIEDGQKAVGSQWRRCPDTERVFTFLDSVVGGGAGFCRDVWSQWREGREGEKLEFSNVAGLIVYLQSLLNDALGLEMLYLPVSRLCESESFYDFARRLIGDAECFAEHYNSAREKQMVELHLGRWQSVRRLSVDKYRNLLEVPLWVVDTWGNRRTLYVALKWGEASLFCDDIELGTLDLSDGGDMLRGMLSLSGYSLRPKAVTLTLFVRLFLADWFVHGVGGGRYEYIVDRIIEEYFGLDGLGFGIATMSVTLGECGGGDNLIESDSGLKRHGGIRGRECFFGLFDEEKLRGIAEFLRFGESDK